MGGLFGGSGGGDSINTVSPVVGSFRIQTAVRGKPIPLVFGKTRVTANLLDYTDFTAIPHTTTTSNGGGGGKGGGGSSGGSSQTDWTYTAAVIMGLQEGAVNSIPTIWADKVTYSGAWTANVESTSQNEGYILPGVPGDHTSYQITVVNASTFAGNLLVQTSASDSQYDAERRTLSVGADYTCVNGVYTFNEALNGSLIWITYKYTMPGYWADACSQVGFSLFKGTYDQAPWGYMTSTHPDHALAYRGVAYVANAAYDLGDSASLPNHSFEVDTQSGYNATIRDANPKDVVCDVFTNPYHGAGFPTVKMGNWKRYSDYCVASGIFVSPAYTEQQTAHDVIGNMMQITNSGSFYSEGLVKIAPFGDYQVIGNGVIFTPDLTPLYDLNDDDFLGDNSSDPIICNRTSNADAFNYIQVNYYNRANQYNQDVATASDQPNIDIYGERFANPVDMFEIVDTAVAQTVAQILLQKVLYLRNTYEFHLGWRYAHLEPMDIVTLTDPALGLNKMPVRVLSVEEDKYGTLTFTAQEMPLGICSPAKYSSQVGVGYAPNYNVTGGNTNPPIFYEPPDSLGNGLTLWIAASGGPLWGSCDVWISDDNQSYKMLGRIGAPSRQGVLSNPLASVADPDTTSALVVDLSMSGGELLSGTQGDADSFNTLCYADGELIAYRDANFISANKYSLSYIRRGAYDTGIRSHNAGTQFTRIDANAILSYAFGADRVGSTVYLKFLSRNVYGAALQLLSDVEAYSYQLKGSALNSPLPNVTNLTTNFISGITQIYWDNIADFRTFDYEVRFGTNWAGAQILGRTPLAKFAAIGDGTYWISAHYQAPDGTHIYSIAPQQIIIAGAVLVKNVVAEWDEVATGWLGSTLGGAVVQSGQLQLQGAGNILAAANVLSEVSILWYGGIATSGEYDFPLAHTIDVGRVAPCNVLIAYAIRGQATYDNVLSQSDFLNVPDVLFASLGVNVDLVPQISLAQADGIFGAWQNFVPGVFNAQYYKARVLLSSSDDQIYPVVTALSFLVDAPDRVDAGSLAISAAGTSVVYSKPFNGGNAGQAVPNVQITILNAIAGDDIVLSGSTVSGFTVQIVNGASGVARSINWTSQGY